MKDTSHQPENGYLTEKIRLQYINYAVEKNLLPGSAYRMANVVSLVAEEDRTKPIQFWQLYSVLGRARIISIVSRFYRRVFEDEAWFTSVFERVATKERHVKTQSSMWIDVMGGGMQYHGGEFRLNFHHTHNALELMNDRGAARWIELMVETLNDPDIDYTDDERVRPAINTFLDFFVGKYAKEFDFEVTSVFGETNPPLKRRINFMNMSSDQVEALTKEEIIDELEARGVDVSEYTGKQALVNKALSL